MRRLAPALLLLALAACQAAPAPTPPVAAVPPTPAPMAARMPAPGPDGVWRGSWTVTQDRSGQCRSPLLPQTVLTITGDRFTIVNRPLGHRGSGMVTPTGALSGTMNVRGRALSVSGVVAEGRLTGTLTGRDCSLRMELSRAG